jgi:hypothetical protein
VLAGVHGRERENGQGEKRKEGEGRWHHLTALGGLLGGMGAKQEVADDLQGQATQLLGKKTKGSFANSPLGFGFFFLEQNKHHPFVLFGDSNYSKVFK